MVIAYRDSLVNDGFYWEINMLKFKFFNKDKSEEVDVKVESDNKSMDDIRVKADKACLKTYNSSVVSHIKAKLMLQYKVRSSNHISMCTIYQEENILVDSICEDIAKEMGLLKEVGNE